MQKVMNSGFAGSRRLWWAAATALFIIIALAITKNAKQFQNRVVFHAWKSKQIEILKENARIGNGLAPLPEQNLDYSKLVGIGSNVRPFLIAELQQLSEQPYRDDEPYLSSLPRYV